MTYEGYIELEKIPNKIERNALELQIQEFGQTPRQLFFKPHPKRYSFSTGQLLPHDSQKKPKSSNHSEESKVLQDPSKHHQISLDSDPESKTLQDSDSEDSTKWVKEIKNMEMNTIEIHKSKVTGIHFIDNQQHLLTTSKDGMLKMYSIQQNTQKRAFFISHPGLSSSALLNQNQTIAVCGVWLLSFF
jgi:factor associated with neutral sphingomyelinase activation